MTEPAWTPGPSDYRRIFQEQNPWQESGEVPVVLAQTIERPLVAAMTNLVTAEKVPNRYQLILGPRRVGKTTSMYQVVRALLEKGVSGHRLWWIRLDHPLLLDWPLGNLVKQIVEISDATDQAPAFLFLDELVYAKNWDLWLKTFYDQHYPVRVIATSSAAAALGTGKESGVGRWEDRYLAPYSLTEYLRLAGVTVAPTGSGSLASRFARAADGGIRANDFIQHRERLILTGGFPELLTLDRDDLATTTLESQRILRSDAVERAIYKDIPQSYAIESPIQLERLLYTLAGRMSGILSPSNLCSDLGIAQPTFDRHLRYLEEAFLVFTLPNYSGSETKVQRRGRKLYFVDGAVRTAALQRGLVPLTEPVEMGFLVENMVASHLHAFSRLAGSRLFHWRDGPTEVDLVLDDPNGPLALEVSMSPSHDRRSILEFVKRHPRFSQGAYIVAPGAKGDPPGPHNSWVGSIDLDVALVVIGAMTDELGS